MNKMILALLLPGAAVFANALPNALVGQYVLQTSRIDGVVSKDRSMILTLEPNAFTLRTNDGRLLPNDEILMCTTTEKSKITKVDADYIFVQIESTTESCADVDSRETTKTSVDGKTLRAYMYRANGNLLTLFPMVPTTPGHELEVDRLDFDRTFRHP